MEIAIMILFILVAVLFAPVGVQNAINRVAKDRIDRHGKRLDLHGDLIGRNTERIREHGRTLKELTPRNPVQGILLDDRGYPAGIVTLNDNGEWEQA
jgi:hypothetical protein